ncbi:hypothetical protein GQ457_02G030770 [Hibiscus cannabinus]
MSQPSGVSSTGDCSLVHWKLPCPGWHSLNIDGVVCLSSGGLLRDDEGHWIIGFSKSIGSCSVLNAELWVCEKV